MLSVRISYAAEVCIWVGIWALASSALIAPFFPYGTVTLALASPLFTWQIVRNVCRNSPLLLLVVKKRNNVVFLWVRCREFLPSRREERRNGVTILSGRGTRGTSLPQTRVFLTDSPSTRRTVPVFWPWWRSYE
jgi:hypothetical protein